MEMIGAWQPTASLCNLKLRAEILKKIRQFFEQKNVLEVETPLICQTTATDPHLTSFETHLKSSPIGNVKLYLQTSPEFAMKRLLAAGYGSIYQIGKAFRNGELGQKHNPEFTILEWYRTGFTHFDLMDEMDELLTLILKTAKADRLSYEELFDSYFGVNPHTCSLDTLKQLIVKYNLIFDDVESDDKNMFLDLLLTHLIEPELGSFKPIFIYDYPESQAALAKVNCKTDYRVGERFEVYFKGWELANGYHELANGEEQLKRFAQDNQMRMQKGLDSIPVDSRLVNALDFFPDCAGVALGLDRLICLAAETNDISEVIAFPILRA